jgi:hypothetical protein
LDNSLLILTLISDGELRVQVNKTSKLKDKNERRVIFREKPFYFQNVPFRLDVYVDKSTSSDELFFGVFLFCMFKGSLK